MADNKSREVIFGYTDTLRITDKEPGSGALTVKVDVDVSEALTGLKALQREAREATKALRELETYYEDADDDCTVIREICMSDIPTKYLHRELAKREGVREYVIGVEDSVSLDFNDGYNYVDGPARIIVNKD